MRLALAFLVGMAMMLAAGWLIFPAVLYQAESQPLAFNHKIHKEKASLECSSCHELAADGQFAGIPKLEGCAMCHAEPVGKTPAEKRLVEEYVKRKREIPWKVYARQPMNARFSHAVHVKRAKLACERCHLNHGTTASLRPYYGDRITGESRDVWGPRMVRVGLRPGEGMKMSDCERCHEERGVAAGCLGCHR